MASNENQQAVGRGYGRRVLIYVAGICAFLFLPFLVVGGLLWLWLPEPLVVAPQYLAADGNAFDIEALQSALSAAEAVRDTVDGCRDHVLLLSGQALVRAVLLEPDVSAAAALARFDGDAQEIRAARGIATKGTESAQLPGQISRLTRFDDGSVAFTQSVGRALFQIVTPQRDDVRTYFRDNGLVVDNQALTPAQRAVSGLGAGHLVGGLLVYSLLWLVGIFRGGAWVAAVPPLPGTSPVPVERMRQRLLGINALDVPLRVTERSPDHLVAEWRLDEQWRGLLESQSISVSWALEMRLRPGVVGVVERKRRLVSEGGRYAWKRQFELFRGITLKSYEAGATYGLSYVDNSLKVTGYQYRFDLQEMKNPLIEMVVTSGWKWEPHVLSA